MSANTLVIPLEIWTECWAHVDKWPEIDSISRTCNDFRGIVLPWIFKFLTVTPTKTESGFWTTETTSKELLQKKTTQLTVLASHPAIPSFIKTLRVKATALSPDCDAGETVLKPENRGSLAGYFASVTAVVAACTNVRELFLECGDVVVASGALAELLSVVSSLPKLEILLLVLTRIPSIILDPLPTPIRLSIEDKSSRTRENETPSETVLISSPRDLHKLVVFSLNISPGILSGILGKNELCPKLTSFALNLPEHSFPLLFEVLKLCPELTQLHIFETGRRGSVSPLQLSPDVGNKIDDFHGPVSLARVLVPGRPMKSVEIAGAPWALLYQPQLLDDLRIFSQATATKSLGFEVPLRLTTPIMFSTLSELFPQLLDLKLHINTDGIGSSYNHTPERIWEKINDKTIPRNKLGEPLEDRITPFQEEDRLETRSDVARATKYKKLVYDVALGKIRLPESLTKLTLDIVHDPHYMIDLEESRLGSRFFEPFTYCMGRRIVHALSAHYPSIIRVKVGFSSGEWNLWWHKEEGTWRALGKK